MKHKILENINDPAALENLFRSNRKEFEQHFHSATAGMESELIKFWNLRLEKETGRFQVNIQRKDPWTLVIIAILTAILVKLPALFPGINQEAFFIRNLAVIAFNGLILFTFRSHGISDRKKFMLYGIAVAVLVIYLNMFPERTSDSIMIAFIHVPLFMWCLFGAAFISFDLKDLSKRTDFIRFNGEIIVMTGLLLIAGGLLSAITIGLFSATGASIEKFYFNNIALPGATIAPVIAFYLIKLYPDITSKIVPVIARLFAPLALLTLLIYLVSLAFSKIKILEDRNLLVLFNVMLVAVTAVIVFSSLELDKTRSKNVNVLILFLLAIVTLIVNSIALTAIITRMTYGMTPNRFVVLATNLLVFINLILIAKDLYRSWFNSEKLKSVDKTVAVYLLIYFGWTIFAIFLLPVLFRWA